VYVTYLIAIQTLQQMVTPAVVKSMTQDQSSTGRVVTTTPA